MAKRQTRILTSIGLIITFLFTAIVLPVVSPYSDQKEVSEFTIKAARDLSGGNAQLPLAEKEKEEENFNKKEQNLVADLISAPFGNTFIPNSFGFIDLSSNDEVRHPLPLYLTKRHLLI